MFDSMLCEVPDPGVPEDAWDIHGWAPPEWFDHVERAPDPCRYEPGVVADLAGWPPDVSPLEVLVGDRTPSGWLAVELDTATTDVSVLDDGEVVEGIVGFDRLVSWAAARQSRLLAEFARRRPGDDSLPVNSDRPSIISRYAPDEIGLALRLSRGAAMIRLGQAIQLATSLGATRDAWEAGRIDAAKVRAICDATVYLSSEHAEAVQDRVLGRAPQQSLGQLRAALARAVIAVDPEGAAERHRAARRDRRVCVGQEAEGMASLWAMLSAPDAHCAYEWLNRLARGLGSQDPRGMDARRADLLVELLTGQLTITPTAPGATGAEAPGVKVPGDEVPGDEVPDTATTTTPGAPAVPTPADPAAPPVRQPVTPGKPLVQVLMPYDTLTGADDQPCELVGYGPIPAELAREIAADAVWKRLVTDPLSGALLDYGRATYHPPAALADFVRARDVYCRAPMCRRRAANCELDHTVPYPEGPTSEDNLWAGCVHDHQLKHHAGWQVTQHPEGQIEWITPTGHRYTSEPYDYRPALEPNRPPPRSTTPKPDTSEVAEDDDEPPF
ncbi:MAG: DUF222 domain-containing protein [Pseudonocardia sp.]